MSPLALAPEALAGLLAEAAATWPREACGVVLGHPGSVERQRFHRFDNLADRLHALDPERYPRDARTAYALDPLKLQRLLDAAEAEGIGLLALCHSHPEHPSYFSATDRAAAAPFGTPTFPNASQIVVSVFGGEVRDLKAFHWDGQDWIERPVEGLPALPGPPPGAHVYGEV